ncbi:hypothetical protein OV090_44605 [Nannocystis sp. RBIL2]|uniref:hypothetical protein n=1 Tax=Nannocystis sp. RBIL2 TaxID=2996788 RepID=UPI00226E583E|nr:hypothetical protein [Nannocystis sp. RBIL2]MCY1071909.1 hypothetical protein [Nannocystis sp. RBIL2]
MSLMSWSLAGLLAFEAAASPTSGARKCELTDNRCKAELFVQRAKEAKSDEQRALYLNVAHRSYLALFDKTGEARHLCAARRLFDRSVAIKNQSAEQRASFEKLRGDLTTREREAKVRCEGPAKQPKAEAPLLMGKSGVPTDPGVAGNASVEASPGVAASAEPPASSAVSVEASASTPQAADSIAPAKPGSDRQREDELLPVSRRSLPPAKSSSSPRAGRDLVIGGGVALGLGVVLASVVTYTGVGMHEVQRQARELRDKVDGHATDGQLAQDAALRREYERLGPPTLALALAGGAATVVGAVLVGVGARRMARRPSQTAFIPVPGGVAFRARF